MVFFQFVAENILSVLDKKQDQQVNEVLELFDIRYGRGMEKVEELVQNLIEFREDQFEDEDKLLLAMEEINQRREKLKVSQKEWFFIWIIGKVKKRKQMEAFEHQVLRDIVKEGVDNVMKNFEDKYKELKVEGSQKSVADPLHIGTDSKETRKRF